MRAPTTGLLVALSVALASPATAAPSPPLAVAGAEDLGCASIEGVFVAFPTAEGTVLVSASPFPGGHESGAIAGGSMHLALPGIGDRDVPLRSPAEGPVWSATDRRLRVAGRQGCVAFDRARFSSAGDLLTYLRWIVEDVYRQLPVEASRGGLALRITDRAVTLVVSAPGFAPLRLSGQEASTLAFRLPEGDTTFLFTPFLLDAEGSRMAVEVATTKGEFWSEAKKDRRGFVLVAPDRPAVTPTEPPLTLEVGGGGS